jgi:hypothetical protein
MARSLDSATLTAAGQKLLPEIAQRVVAGDVANAAALLPGLSKVALGESYFHAFQSLTAVLALVTAGAAVTCSVAAALTRPVSRRCKRAAYLNT